jgi:hypothetical protein
MLHREDNNNKYTKSKTKTKTHVKIIGKIKK